MTVKSQLKNKVWTDEAGNNIPLTHVKPVEKVNERVTVTIATKALKINEALNSFKAEVEKLTEQAFDAFRIEYKGKKQEHKGNISIFSFDRSIKVVVRVSEAIKFDDQTINQAKEKLIDFLKDGISAKDTVIKDMVLDAFNTAGGKLDVKKIFGLKRYASRISDSRYAEAMKLIDEAIRRPDSATYYQVWLRNAKGVYDAVPLALADV
jgi:hypothetical protein